jgi:hypothetical protein
MASQLDLLKKYKSLFSTTLSTGIGTGTTDTITPATVTGLPTTTGITLTFDRIDSAGVATPTKLERITGVISAGNFTSYVRAKDGTTEQAHTANAVIEMVWNAQDWNDLVDWGLVEHTQLGVHTNALVTTLKASAAEVTTGTNDTKIVTPLAATGIDTRTATFTNKTLTAPLFQGRVDGWILANETWTYASASTINVPTGAASKYAKGDRIKWTQTTVKYGVIVAVADTLLTIMVNTDYVVANAAISANYYSHEANPVGYPDWFNIAAPTWAVAQLDDGAGGQPTVALCRGRVNNRTFEGYIRLSPAYAASAGGYWNFGANVTFPTIVNRPARSVVGVGHTQTVGDVNLIMQVFTIGTTIYMQHPTSATIADNTQFGSISYMLEWEI